MTEDKKIAIEHGILDRIEQDGRVTQTELARGLRISIGLCNAYVKRLVRKGYVKVTNFKASSIKYVLTPEGIALKYHLTRSYMARSLDYYKKIKKAVESRITKLKLEEVRNVVFVGTGEVAEIMYLYLGGTKIELLGVFDFIDGSEEKTFFKFDVLSVEQLPDFVDEKQVNRVLVNSLDLNNEVYNKLIELGIDKKYINIDF